MRRFGWRVRWALMVRNYLRSVIERIFSSYVAKGSHTTSGRQHGSSQRQHGSSQTLVIFFNFDIGVQAQASSQGINYARTFSNGSLRRIRQLTTPLPVVPITRRYRSGFSVGVFSPNGSPMDRFCGSTENVRSPHLSSVTIADGHLL